MKIEGRITKRHKPGVQAIIVYNDITLAGRTGDVELMMKLLEEAGFAIE